MNQLIKRFTIGLVSTAVVATLAVFPVANFSAAEEPFDPVWDGSSEPSFDPIWDDPLEPQPEEGIENIFGLEPQPNEGIENICHISVP